MFLTLGEYYISFQPHVLQSERLPQRMLEESRNGGTRDAGREKLQTFGSLSVTCFTEYLNLLTVFHALSTEFKSVKYAHEGINYGKGQLD